MASIRRLLKSWTHKRETWATVATRCTACNKHNNKIRLVVVGERMNMQNTEKSKTQCGRAIWNLHSKA